VRVETARAGVNVDVNGSHDSSFISLARSSARQ
jgi:hypothetical protein